MINQKFGLLDELLESAANPVILLNKTDLLDSKEPIPKNLRLASGKVLSANLVSLMSDK